MTAARRKRRSTQGRKRARARHPRHLAARACRSPRQLLPADASLANPIAAAARTRYSQTCPACEGLLTDDDVRIGRTWARLRCPHCGHRDKKRLNTAARAADAARDAAAPPPPAVTDIPGLKRGSEIQYPRQLPGASHRGSNAP